MSDALMVALGDAEYRAKEEARRVADRLGRPESGDLRPRERERLTEMMNRSDVLNNAYHTVERDDWPDEERNRETLEILKEMQQEANEYFLRYRWEVGLRRREVSNTCRIHPLRAFRLSGS